MDKYTIVVPGRDMSAMNFKTFEEVNAKSKELCDKEIYHIIRDNEFNTSVKMAEVCR